VEEIQSTGYYALGNDKVLLPYHSLAGFNPGHLVWDDFLPIYTLLSIFGLVSKELVLMRMNVEPTMWASCQTQYSKCAPIIEKFYPLLGTDIQKVSTQNDTQFEIQGEKKSKYICAPNGAAGMGMLTDHGLKLHGWIPEDYETMHNHGRGASVYAFRNWMMENIGIAPETKKIHNAPYKIVFSTASSSQQNRNMTFEKHAQLLEEKLGSKYNIVVIEVVLSQMSLEDQIELVSGGSIFITVCGGGALTAMFLPKGAALFAYFNEDDIYGTPARLDWDLLNNMGYIRSHWLPTRPGEHDFDAFVKLVDHELDVISHTNDV